MIDNEILQLLTEKSISSETAVGQSQGPFLLCEKNLQVLYRSAFDVKTTVMGYLEALPDPAISRLCTKDY